jgi:hypothetical protein
MQTHKQYSKPLLIKLQLIHVLDNTDRNIQNGKRCSQLSTYFKRHTVFRKADESLCAMTAHGETEHTLHCLACCSVSLLTLSHADVIAYIASFAYFTNLDYHLIRITSPPPINPDWRGFTVYTIHFQV